MIYLYFIMLSVAKTTYCGTADSLKSELQKRVYVAYLEALLLSPHFREGISQKKSIQDSLRIYVSDIWTCRLPNGRRRSTESRTVCLKQQSVYMQYTGATTTPTIR
jgi:hypothetical protein